jgi:hypothetical protein
LHCINLDEHASEKYCKRGTDLTEHFIELFHESSGMQRNSFNVYAEGNKPLSGIMDFIPKLHR